MNVKSQCVEGLKILELLKTECNKHVAKVI